MYARPSLLPIVDIYSVNDYSIQLVSWKKQISMEGTLHTRYNLNNHYNIAIATAISFLKYHSSFVYRRHSHSTLSIYLKRLARKCILYTST